MTKFEKPGKREDFDYPDMAKEAVTNALTDAGNINTIRDIKVTIVLYQE